jgi:phosphatidylethanolamine/phosphatidyl-N-methylethanolamine N-methyltransferase
MNWDILVFLKAWIRSPRKIGAVIPSSPILAKAMADQVKTSDNKTVVELGAGTGSVTHALLQHGIQPQNLIVIESDPVFCKRLRLRFPDVRILNVDATRLEQVFHRYEINNINSIVSSLPLLSLDRRSQSAILEQSFRLLGQDGEFIQYTYGIGSPIRKWYRRHFEVDGYTVKQIWRNVPPATIWRYKQSEPEKQFVVKN